MWAVAQYTWTKVKIHESKLVQKTPFEMYALVLIFHFTTAPFEQLSNLISSELYEDLKCQVPIVSTFTL